MPLEEYRRKRKFGETTEPSGRTRRGRRHNPTFVIQKHAARRLHYDFRLEINGVMVSWAVPKGPSLNPAEKRLAVMTEDHPMEYSGFEGTIPEGNYGAGTVMVWDRGTYSVVDDPPAEDQLSRGEIKFELHGEKLKGGFVLVHTGRSNPARKKQWLLIKHHDEYEDRSWDILDPQWDHSALSGRTLNEIAEGRPAKKRAGSPRRGSPAAAPAPL